MTVKQVLASSKVIKCELVNGGKEEGAAQKPLNSKEFTIHNLKPGFLVAAKVQRILDNGIELYFLGGFTGTVFADHLDKGEPSKYKLGDKVTARVVSVDTTTQAITLSLLPHLLKFENASSNMAAEGIAVGKVFEQSTVSSVAFGSSYKLSLTPTMSGFLHKIHAVKKEKKKADDEDDAPAYTQVELEKGQKVQKVRVKEINYFDGLPILSMRDDIVQTEALNYE